MRLLSSESKNPPELWSTPTTSTRTSPSISARVENRRFHWMFALGRLACELWWIRRPAMSSTETKPIPMTARLSAPHERAVLIGRFQPFHNAHHALLRKALDAASRVVVVIGSAFQHDRRRTPSPGRNARK